MRGILLAACLTACGSGSGGSGSDGGGGANSELTFSAETDANNLFDGTVPIAETRSGDVEGENTISDFVFSVGTAADAASVRVVFFGPAVKSTWAIGDHKVAEMDAGEAVVIYTEGGMARTWRGSDGTLTISVASPPVVAFQIAGVAMFANGTSGALGTFTLDGQGTTAAFAP